MSKIIEKILEILQAQAEAAVDLLDIVTSDYSTSYRKARRSLLRGPPQFQSDWADRYRQRQAFHALLNKLKREGFIVRKEKKRNSLWSITTSGIRKLAVLREKSEKWKSLPRLRYGKQRGLRLIIFAFDIPERERRKRQWLRTALVALGFKKLQQSVWVGKIQIPPEFIKDLKDHSLLPCVHIFSVTEKGTIQENEVE